MNVKYKEFTGLNLPAIEKEILAKWKAEAAFEQSISLREGAEPFVFYEGPPSANGMPGIHHVISRTLKDLVCRYKTMQGFQVKRKGGWDTHGLPVELGVEKELGITKEDIGKKISVEDYNKKCREAVLRYKREWDDLTTQMGYWVDLNNPYITFTNEYIESLWWLLKELYKKGLLYESVSIQPYSPAAGTGLSSHELNQPGCYRDVKDTSCVAMFKAVRNDKSEFLFSAIDETFSPELFFLAWTTTPWTLPSNLGLTVGPNIDYVLVKTYNPYTHLPVHVILAKALLGKYFKTENENTGFDEYSEKAKALPWQVLAGFTGIEIEECRYEQLMPYEANTPEKSGGDPFRIILGDFVTTEDGTGIVHTAPAFGADDFKVGKKYNIGILTMVDRQGKFINGLGEFSNRYVKDYTSDPNYVDVNVDISVKLKLENRAFKVEKYEHSYPHCWRTDKPVLYYPLDAWFIKTTACKDRMVELNKTINWKPKSTGEGRFGNWLENMVDWNLSRSRFWGTPLPVWRTEDGEEEICIGSIEELKEEITKADKQFGTNHLLLLTSHGLDLHKPFIDEVILVSPSGKQMKRIPDLIDVWFDSGAMPYAQWHYPFENKDLVDQHKAFPADFIAEGVDQTRGWFYTLHALAVMLFDSVAYKTVVSNGLVLDKNGEKMSKRLGNVVNPFETINTFGADATRWYLMTNASPWDNLKFNIQGIQEVQRKFFGTLYNIYQFFALYANVDGFNFSEDYIELNKRPEIDRWILSALNTLVQKVTSAMNDYEPTIAGRAIEEFVDEQLSNWYVRLCRRRFWKGEYEHDKISAYQTLYECLITLTKLMAPVSPFFSDAVYNQLNEVTGKETLASVHHASFPVFTASAVDTDLEERMQLAQDICSLVLSLRKKVNIKVRQPLQKILIPILNSNMKHQLQMVEDLIKSEVNIKQVEYITNTEGLVHKIIKPNFKKLGAKLGANMKAAAAMLTNLDQADISKLEKEGSLVLEINNQSYTILNTEVEVVAEDIPGWSVASKGLLTVALDIEISEALKQEGDAREFINRVQNLRKENDFYVTDRIEVEIENNETLRKSINQFKNYICAEILADSISWVPLPSQGTEIEINDTPVKISLIKNNNCMAVKKAAPKKAAKTTIKTAKKAVAPKKAAVKKAVKKPSPVTKKAAPAEKTPAKNAPLKKVKMATGKKAVPKKATILKTPISKPMAKKEDIKKVTVKNEEVKTEAKTNGAIPKKASAPAAKKQPETLTAVAATATGKKAATATEIKIPKTTMKTSVPYQPEYKTLDQRQTATNGKANVPLVRYNDNELNEFRELINKKLEAAKKELAYLQGLITRRDDQGGDEGDNRYMTMEDGGMSMEREQLSQMASRQITYIDHLEKALIRIENKTYGICRVTGKLIDKARLRAVPHATLSLEAKLGLVKPGTE